MRHHEQKHLNRVWEMWSCDSSTIRLGAMPKQLDVHDLHMNTHKLSCQHPTQIQLIFKSTSETTNYQQQTQTQKKTGRHKNKRTDLRQARSRQAWQRKQGWRTSPRETSRRKRKLSGLNLRLHTMKKTSVQSHTKNNMYLYRYICKFLKECGALVRVALSAEALGADGLLSVWDQRLASALNAYNSRFVASTTLSSSTSPPTESWEFSLMVQTPPHRSSGCSTRWRRDWSDARRGSCRGALPTRTSPRCLLPAW